MYRIDNATAATTIPTPGSVGPNPNGFFTAGSPGVTQATVVDADWANAVQEEICNVITDAGITLSKTTRTQLLAAIQVIPAGRLLNVQVFTAAGTYTPTTGTNSIIVEAVGGGGGSGGNPAQSSGSGALSGAGSGGSYAKARYTAGFTGGISVTVGAAGAAGTSTVNGGNGGASSFGSLMSCPGGNGGAKGGGALGFVVVASAAAPAAATVTGGTTILNISGQGGEANFASASGGPAITAAGGNSFLGLGGPAQAAQSGNSNGSSGTGYGAGAGAAYTCTSGAASNGAAGLPGIVIVYEYS